MNNDWLSLAAAVWLLGASFSAADERGPGDFESLAAPILRERCLECHADKASGGLRLDSRQAMMAGGDSGPAVIVGQSGASPLMERVAADSSDELRMPPEGPRLTAEQIGRLKQWIDAGAPWPDGLVLKTPRAAAGGHWAFQPLGRPQPPPAAGGENAIDAFVLVALQARGIEPSPQAERRTLWRRVALDLTGLPPSSEDEALLEDPSPGAYERFVDRLLASPAYGERWARPWLDLCHYADTDGYLTDQERPVAWRYRQWLIEALNGDLPFDRFSHLQLAGDLLAPTLPDVERTGALLATGFLRNTLSNREGGADLEEYRVEQIVDRSTMVGVGWLGLTVGCARCHDHKYDPISQKEFYRLYAFFNQADEVNIDAPLPGEATSTPEQRAEYRRQRDAILAPVISDIESLQAKWEAKMLEAVVHPSREPIWDRQWEVLGLIWGGHFGEGQLEGCAIVQTPLADRTQDEKDRLLDYFLARGSLIDEKRFSELKLGEIASRLEELKKSIPWPTRAPVMRAARIPRATRVHVRGDFRVPGELVAPGLFDWLGAGEVNPGSDTDSHLTRIDLARWLTSPRNPLTARVVVNRLWQEFFGRGLVDPPDDFGLRGQPPSHPQLLDWLASELVRRNWSIKEMQRLIVTSATYRQSSQARPDVDALDPNQRLLARQTPLRFTADQVRDVTLAVSRLLERRIGGPSVFPPQPESVAKEGFSNVWKTSEGADRYRRGLYTWLQRLSPFAQSVTFDAPPTNSICTRRDRSNSPLQSLTLLNDPVFFEAARAMAGQLLRDRDGKAEVNGQSPLDDGRRIQTLYAQALWRPATEMELQVLGDFLRDQRAYLAAHLEEARQILGLEAPVGDSPPPAFGPAEVERAAWTSVASVVLNTHEFITRD